MNDDTVFILADNQDITRAGLCEYISMLAGGYRIINVSDKKELVTALMKEPKGVVILDYTLFDLNGEEDLLIIGNRFPGIRWILFSNELSGKMIRRMSSENSTSIILKECPGEEIRFALKCAAHGERFLCHQIKNMLLTTASTHETPSALTVTETDILKLIAHGKTVKEIASMRKSSIHTIITHKKNIFRKLDISNVYEATRYALKAGFIDMVEYYI